MVDLYYSFHLHKRALNRQLFNPGVIKHNKFDCHISTAKNCGTHWVKYMLSHLISELYDVPPPEHIHDDSVVGHTKNRSIYDNIPQIALTHSHPHYLLRMPGIFKFMNLPRFAVLVRDPRDILISKYEKVKGDYLNRKMNSDTDITFSQFIRSNPEGKYRLEDIWGVILYFNSWGPVIKRHPKNVLLIRYEDLKKNTTLELSRLCDHIGIENYSEDAIERAIAKSSKKEMKENQDMNETLGDKIVRTNKTDFRDYYNDEDKKFVSDVCRTYLKYPFSYDLEQW